MSADGSLDVGRFGRTLALIGFVTAVFLFTGSWTLSSELFAIAAVVVGSIAIVTAIVGFLIATASSLE